MPIRVNSASQCERRCKTNPKCQTWDYDSCGGSDCWLKSSIPDSYYDNCRSNGLRRNIRDDNTTASPTPTFQPSPVGGLTPNGIKAGIAGGDAYPWLQDHLGWWYDWSATPSKAGRPIAVPMLWGVGQVDDTDRQRLSDFKNIRDTPKYILGYEEPDCKSGSGSAGISVWDAARTWDELVAPFGRQGSLIISPSMCKQADEDWLTPFKNAVKFDWNITAVHINKVDMDGVRKDLDHYWNVYKKPIWVTEFACVNDVNGFVPCTDQNQINRYINDIVDLMEADSRVYAYGYSNGWGLGEVWPLTRWGQLSDSGRTYLNAISKYH